MAEFKDRLEQALKNRDMRPAELARLTDINEGAISQYRKGAYKATQRNLEKISKVLGVSIPWLMGAEDEKEPAVPKDDELTHAIILGRNGKAIRRTYSRRTWRPFTDCWMHYRIKTKISDGSL